MDKFQEMQSFVNVVDIGSFVGAADYLNTSKAAVSRHVADLEKRLGVRLLNRTTRTLSLTSDGQIFYARCKEILLDIQEAELELCVQQAEVLGNLRINAPLSFGISHLAPLWGHFCDLYPKINLDITLSDKIVDLVEEGYDLAIRISHLPSSSLISRKLASTRLVLCASPNYLAKYGDPKHPDDLIHHSAISYTYSPANDIWQLEGPNGGINVKINSRLRTNNGDTCRIAAVSHQGITLQPLFLIEKDLNSGLLKEVLPSYCKRELGIYAVYSSRKQLPRKLRALIDFLVESFKNKL